MALPTIAQWGIRSGGNDLNGCGYKTIDGDSVNYCHQDVAQLSLSDLATPGAGSTTLTSATGGLTLAMKGNWIYIAAGTNFTVDYYQITAHTNTNTVTLDRSPTPGGAGGGDGEGKVGGSRATLIDAALEAISAGDAVHIENGTYTPGAAINVAQGGGTISCRLLGYNVTPADVCRGNNRPLIQMAGNGFMFTGGLWVIAHLRLTMEDAVGLRVSANTLVTNVDVQKNINNSNSRCFYSAGSDCHLLDCAGWSIQSPVKGRGVEGAGWASVMWCEFYDLEEGMDLTQVGCTIAYNVVRDCIQIGIDANADAQVIVHNTVDGNTDGIDIGPQLSLVIINNQISHNSGDGIVGTALNALLEFNNYHDNGADVSGVVKGPNATANDPDYTSEAGNNFSGVDDDDGFPMLRGVS